MLGLGLQCRILTPVCCLSRSQASLKSELKCSEESRLNPSSDNCLQAAVFPTQNPFMQRSKGQGEKIRIFLSGPPKLSEETSLSRIADVSCTTAVSDHQWLDVTELSEMCGLQLREQGRLCRSQAAFSMLTEEIQPTEAFCYVHASNILQKYSRERVGRKKCS